VHWAFHAVLSAISLVPAGDRAALRGDHRRALAFPEIRHLRHLDPGHDPGPRHGSGDGDPGAAGAHRRIRDRRRNGGRERRAVRAARRRQSRDGARLGAQGLHRRRGWRHGQPGRLDRRLDLHQSLGILRFALGEPGPGRDLLVRRADPHAAVPAHGPVRSHAQMSTRRAAGYWIAFSIVLALLIVAPLALPEFWRRLLTEILIWGLLAMSSDFLIGYTGMVSFGHSAFFGLGIYGAAAALLWTSPPNLWVALLFGLIGAAAVAAFVAYFSTRLRDIYFAITTLIFSQIFYVIIFTSTQLTVGHNG